MTANCPDCLLLLQVERNSESKGGGEQTVSHCPAWLVGEIKAQVCRQTGQCRHQGRRASR